MDLPETKTTSMQQRGTARLDMLTRTAADMFLAGGYDALSIDALIERVGGSRRNVYEHFGGKEQLFIEAVGQRCIELGEPIAALKLDDAEVPARQALQKFGRTLLDVVLSPEVLALHRLMVAEGHRFPDLAAKAWRSGHNSAAQILGRWVARQQQTGRLEPSGDPFRLADQFISMVIADAQLRRLVSMPVSALETKAILNAAVETFLHGRIAGHRVRKPLAAGTKKQPKGRA
jgi:AcrR family transcriptional regulator